MAVHPSITGSCMQRESLSSRLPPRVRRLRLTRDRLTAMVMIAPSVAAIAVFIYGFIAWTGYVSLTAWNGILPDYRFVGLQNYVTIFSTGRFQTDLRNMIVFTVLFLIGCLAIGLILALLVDTRIKGEHLFRSIYLFPMALSFIVTGVAWSWLFNPGNLPGDPTGINLLLHTVHLDVLESLWLTDARVLPGWYPDWLHTRIGVPLAILPVVIAAIWQMSGFTMAMYLVGLRGIPTELYEAAQVDGATEWQLFREITLPLLRPVTLSVVII